MSVLFDGDKCWMFFNVIDVLIMQIVTYHIPN